MTRSLLVVHEKCNKPADEPEWVRWHLGVHEPDVVDATGVAHITFWEQTMVTNLRKITRGEHGEYISGDVDMINEQVFAANQQRPPGLIMTEFQRSHKELLELVDQLSNDDLTDPDRFTFRDEPLWKYIWAESGEHYGDHNGDLYSMIQQVKSGTARAAASSRRVYTDYVPLSVVRRSMSDSTRLTRAGYARTGKRDSNRPRPLRVCLSRLWPTTGHWVDVASGYRALACSIA